MEFWDRLGATAERFDVLRHPFYVRWSEGTLTRAELGLYAGQYAHAVRALASAARTVADTPEAEGHAAEEESHIELWDEFARATGAGPAAPLPETSECIDAWADPDRSKLATIVALYAIESAQPAISEVKRAGLVDLYGFEAGPATAYFDVHAERDLEHARAGRAAISALRSDDSGDDALVAEAERVLAANWLLLDGVDRARQFAR
jgi:pyrroloquinoline-quinone synthase